MAMRFYVNKEEQRNGEHEVHTGTCVLLPQETNRIDLDEHYSCASAMAKAKEHFNKVNGCFYCCVLCHVR
jgi:hypothetical protein